MSSNMWRDKWSEDIEFLKDTLIKKHKNLFFNINRECFENNIKQHKGMIEKLDYDEMKVEISRVG